MKIYSDIELKNEVEKLDLGIVKAGETKRFIFWVENDTSAHFKEMKFIVNHKEVKIIESPKELPSFASAKLILEWSPSVTLKEGLKTTLKVKRTELWGV